MILNNKSILVKTLKFLAYTIFFSFITFHAFAQNVEITGTVITSKGDPIPDATVFLNERFWDTTNKKGRFSILGSSSGELTLIVNSLGYYEKKVSIDTTSSKKSFIEIILREKVYKDDEVVVTASRSEKNLEDVSVPISVVDKKEIEQSGSIRLSDVLAEQIGMNIVSDHGTGIQVQGFDPEYTLIMIDNQPVIGRTAGTLDLTRLAVGNIKQIEIVKGPSSALWGSDALAGVINIITDRGDDPLNIDLNTRYGTNNSYDGSSNITFKKDRLNGRLFGNINGTDGYDLNTQSLAPTVPEYQNYTFSGGLDYRATDRLIFKLNSRYFQEDLDYLTEATIEGKSEIIAGDQTQFDYSISPEIAFTASDRQLFELIGFTSRFDSKTRENITESNAVFSSTNFDQTLNKIELKSSTFWNEEHTTVAGVGINQEDLISDNYAEIPAFTSFFSFGQHEWKFSEELSVTGGFRFDAHSEYSSQFSPKLSTLYKPNDFIHFRASVGSGFKAPAFNQLFLNFTNATVGYSVFGTSTVVQGMQELQESGRIDSVLVPVSQVTDIRAESSFSYNAGFEIFPHSTLRFKTNFFRNNVQDMIDSQRIAFKTNGQSVFSYFNLNQVYTQGIETELQFTPDAVPGLRLGLGYQFLDARQEFKIQFDDVENGQVVSKTKTEYGIIPNRSKHTGNFKVFYLIEKLDLETSFRASFRGKYGVDFNGNEQVDAGEYVLEANNAEEAFDKTIMNFSIAKTFFDRFRWMVGINNLTGYQNAEFLPSQPGTTFYTQININLY